MSRKLKAFRCEENLLFLSVLPHLPHIFLSIVPCFSHQVRNYICVSVSIFAFGHKAKNINQSGMFALENLWVKIFQSHGTLLGEDIKTLQVYLH